MCLKSRWLFLGIIVMLMVTLAIPAGNVLAAVNLAENPGFETGGTTGPDAWISSMWDTNNPSEFRWETGGGHSGQRYVTIISRKLNHAYYSQTVKVRPDTIYRLSCWIKTEGISKDRKGAGIGVKGLILTNTNDISNSNGQWKYDEIYGKTGPSQREVTILLMLGDYGQLSSGKASFDDFGIQEATAVLDGQPVNDLYKPDQTATTANTTNGNVVDLNPGNTKNENLYNERTAPWINLALAVLGIYLLVAAFFLFRNQKNRQNNNKQTKSKRKARIKQKWADKVLVTPEPEYQKYQKYFYIAIGISLLFRFVVAPLYQGYSFDYGMFRNWAGDRRQRFMEHLLFREGLCGLPSGLSHGSGADWKY